MSDDEILRQILQIIKDKPRAYFNYLMSNKHIMFKNFILDNSSFLNDKVDCKHNKPFNATTRIIYCINKLVDFPKCCICGKPIERNLSLNEDLTKLHCSNKCAQKDIDNINKIKATKLKKYGNENFNNIHKAKNTCYERYGVDSYLKTEQFKNDAEQTHIKKYGVAHHMKSDTFKSEMRKRYKEKHGAEYSFANPDVKKKINKTFQEKYGVDWIMQSPEFRKIMHENSAKTQTTMFYTNILSKNEYVKPMFSLDEWLAVDKSDKHHIFKWQCKKCGKIFESHLMRAARFYARCYDCYPVVTDTSLFEQEIADFIYSLGNFEVLNHTTENKKYISPKEIDIIVKKDGKAILGIEANGLYWHSVLNGKDKFYHLDKTEACEKQNIQLLHIFDDEWRDKQEIVKSRIKTILGVIDKKIFARKCVSREISTKDAKTFLNANHLQGYCQSKIKLGLFFDNVLVSVMTFGKKRKITNAHSQNEDDYELLRYACKCGYQIIGGASKLLSYFEKTFKPNSLLSYADRRWSLGNMYVQLGFSLDHIAQPNYWYVDPSHEVRLYRFGYRKSVQHKLLKTFDSTKSEMENMFDNGYDVIWDCGNYVFLKKYNI